MRHSAIKLEKYTFINANIQVIKTILNVNRDNRQTFKCKQYSLKLFLWHSLKFNSIPTWTALGLDKTKINVLVQSKFEHSLHLICKNQFSVKQYQFQKSLEQVGFKLSESDTQNRHLASGNSKMYG